MSMRIRKHLPVEMEITIEELAEAIASLQSDDQARLISEIANRASTFSVPMQLQYITDDPALTSAGRRLMRLLGDYSSPTTP